MNGLPREILNPATRLLRLCELVDKVAGNDNQYIGQFMSGPFGLKNSEPRISILLNSALRTIDECEALLTRCIGEQNVGPMIEWCDPMRKVLSPLNHTNLKTFKTTFKDRKREMNIAASFFEKAIAESGLIIFEGSEEQWSEQVGEITKEISEWKIKISNSETTPAIRQIVVGALIKLEESLVMLWVTGPDSLQEAYFYARGVESQYGSSLAPKDSKGIDVLLSKFNTFFQSAKNLGELGRLGLKLLESIGSN